MYLPEQPGWILLSAFIFMTSFGYLGFAADGAEILCIKSQDLIRKLLL
jgi:hypothetical protein